MADWYQSCDVFAGESPRVNLPNLIQCELSKFITLGTFDKTLLSV